MRDGISKEEKAEDAEFSAAVEAAIGAALEEDAKRPLSDAEKEAIVRIRKRLDDQLASFERK